MVSFGYAFFAFVVPKTWCKNTKNFRNDQIKIVTFLAIKVKFTATDWKENTYPVDNFSAQNHLRKPPLFHPPENDPKNIKISSNFNNQEFHRKYVIESQSIYYNNIKTKTFIQVIDNETVVKNTTIHPCLKTNIQPKFIYSDKHLF